MVQQLNAIISRRIAATASAVLSITQIHGGHTHNVIPAEVRVSGTVRTFDPAVQDRIEASIREIATGIGIANGVSATVDYQRYYPATINDAEAAQEALDAAATVGNALIAPDPAFTSEDFAFMLQACKGAYIWLGQAKGDGGTPLHNPHYDFNDDVLALGIKLHVALAERHLAR